MEWTRADFLHKKRPTLTYEIHDKHFNVDLLHYDKAQRLWSLPIGDEMKGPYDSRIVVTEVTGCRIKDPARIGFYSIYSMRYKDAKGVLRLRSNQSLKVWLAVAPDFRVRIVQLAEHRVGPEELSCGEDSQ